MVPARPKEYGKGPGIENKAERTKRRYKKHWHTQTRLDRFCSATSAEPPLKRQRVSGPTQSPTAPTEIIIIDDSSCSGSDQCEILDADAFIDEPEPLSQSDSPPLSATQHLPPPSPELDLNSTNADELPALEAEEWELEAEVVQLLPNVRPEIRNWKELREQIKDDLRQKSKTLPLSKINQLMILRNFATLQLKGYGKLKASQEIARQWHEGEGVHFARQICALARHYQLYEQLPDERRGGVRAKTRSLLMDATVKTAARSWLMNQKVGSVTPRGFCTALNNDILPSVNITLSRDLCEKTARRWLLRLGFRRSILRKGIYKDGHDREDVKEYRDKVFLPKMKEFERLMTQYHLENGKLIAQPPDLAPGEREIVALFHDECCFHANDFKSSAWYVSTNY